MVVLRRLATFVLLSSGVIWAQCPREPKKTEKPRHEPLTIPMRVLLSHALVRVQPVFPDEARRARIDGEVVIGIEVDHEGAVTRVEPLSGDPLLRTASGLAARQWRFESFCIDGRPYTVRSVLDFQFRWRGAGVTAPTP